MNWLRGTLKRHRIFVLAFLLVETFYWADGLQFVYAHEIREQEREVHLQSLSGLLGIPVEKLRGERRSLFEPLEGLAEDVSSSVGVVLDNLISTLRRQTRQAKSEVSRLASRLDEFLEAPDATPVASVEPAAFLGSPQEAEEPESARLRTISPATQDTPRERTGRASRSEPKALSLRQVERKARTEKAVGSARGVHSSAVAPASTPRRVILKDGVAPEIAALAQSLLKVETGRFLSMDPAELRERNPQEVNRYVYVKNDPLDLVDPSGKVVSILTLLFASETHGEEQTKKAQHDIGKYHSIRGALRRYNVRLFRQFKYGGGDTDLRKVSPFSKMDSHLSLIRRKRNVCAAESCGPRGCSKDPERRSFSGA